MIDNLDRLINWHTPPRAKRTPAHRADIAPVDVLALDRMAQRINHVYVGRHLPKPQARIAMFDGDIFDGAL